MLYKDTNMGDPTYKIYILPIFISTQNISFKQIKFMSTKLQSRGAYCSKDIQINGVETLISDWSMEAKVCGRTLEKLNFHDLNPDYGAAPSVETSFP